MYLCRQKFPRERIEAPAAALNSLLASSWIGDRVRPGARIAITGGSRGIAAIVPLVKALVDYLHQLGGRPFVVNAMGSHGGATASGQREVLASLGMTEENLGCPVCTSMEVEQIGALGEGFPVWCDCKALEADHLVVINRVKLHTSLRGPVQSGLCKMLTVGLGKEKQAAHLHRYGPETMGRLVVKAAALAIKKLPVLAGIAIVENAYNEVARLELVRPEDFIAADTRLLKEAARLQPALPVQELGLLVVEEMGKCYSGAGLDPHVIGRWRIWGEPEPEFPRIQRVVVLRLAPASHGNAQGVGLADFITKELYENIDLETTYKNILTSTFVQRGMIPIIAATEQQAIADAIYSLPLAGGKELKVAWIKNTLQLETLALSEAVLKQLAYNNRIEKLGPVSWCFNEQGKLNPWVLPCR